MLEIKYETSIHNIKTRKKINKLNMKMEQEKVHIISLEFYNYHPNPHATHNEFMQNIIRLKINI